MTKREILVIVVMILCCLLWTTSCEYLEEAGPQLDSDGDGWSDAHEKITGTATDNVDTDNDGYWDPHDPNPLDPNIPGSYQLPDSTTGPMTTPSLEPTTSSTHNTTLNVSPEQSAFEELREVQTAVGIMMKNNKLTSLANPVNIPTNDMHRFPDTSVRDSISSTGYVLYCHDFNGNGKADTNYILYSRTKGTYTCDKYGNVTQVTTGYD
jgi:hypothetical protein